MDEQPAPVLDVSNLVVEVDTPHGPLRLVDDVSFTVRENEVLCIVGESGSGKSVTLLALMRLLPPELTIRSGRILLRGQDLGAMSVRQLRELRGRSLAMIFQDPMTSFNPVVRVGRQLGEAVRLHRPDLSRQAVREKVVAMLSGVRIPDAAARYRAYPHEFSGGMRQRAMIAMATAHEPDLLLADEPTTALDVTVQRQVLDVLEDMRGRVGSSMILVTHDLGLVAENADRVVVMYGGRVVESGTTEDIFLRPSHPYTVGLLASTLHMDVDVDVAYAIPGQPPAPSDGVTGCAFHPRCGLRQGRTKCAEEVPALHEDAHGHAHACWFSDETAEWVARDFDGLVVGEKGRARVDS